MAHPAEAYLLAWRRNLRY